MSRQGPVLFVDCDGGSLVREMLAGLSQFPMIEVAAHDAAKALAQVKPAAVLSTIDADDRWREVAAEIERATPYLPLFALGDAIDPPEIAIRFSMSGFSRGDWLPRLDAR